MRVRVSLWGVLTLCILFLLWSKGSSSSSSSLARAWRDKVLDLLFIFLLPALGLLSKAEGMSVLLNLIFFST